MEIELMHSGSSQQWIGSPKVKVTPEKEEKY